MTSRSTTGDPYVYNVQRWLNSNYGQYVESGRFNLVQENGVTGWATINALIRALQIELGIQVTADNFGSGTVSAFNTAYPTGIHQQADDDETENKIYGIIQGALLCKGYETGVNTPTLHFYNGTGNAIKKLKEHAGIDFSTSTVTLNIMKALLSMNYFYTYDISEKSRNIQKIQRYLNGNYENYIGLRPCDGVYSRETSVALILAFQAEEGMPTNVANGNFGPSTRRCCPTIPYNNVEKNYSDVVYNSTQISKFIKLLNMGLYVNGIGNGNFDDGFSSNLVSEFQTKYGLESTGICDLTTWASIFISCGDTSRSAVACDCATILTPEKAQTLYQNGYRYVGRYLSGIIANGQSKALTTEELNIAFDAGLRIFPIYQNGATTVSYFTQERAEIDVNSAYDYATNLNIPAGTIIYFAVDCDPQDYQITSNIIPYFKKLYETMRDTKDRKYRIGIYGTRNVCTRISKLGYAVSSFVSDMSTGYSGNLGFSIPENWAFDQFTTVTIGSGNGRIEIDKDGFSGRDFGIGELGLNEILKVFYNLMDIYTLALDYTDNDISESNLLVLEYLRYLKGGNYGSVSDDYDGSWKIMAGDIDATFCNIVNNALGNNIDLIFHDPINTSVEYDILHLAATLNAIMYPVITEDLAIFDSVVDQFAGWAGDVVTFGDSICANGNTQEWANNSICSATVPSKFELSDYLADADAVIIGSMLNNDSNLSFPEAFYKYFNTIDSETGKLFPATRTNRFMLEMGSYNQFLVDGEIYITSNDFPFPTFRNMLKQPTTQQEHMNKAFIAFGIFVGNQIIAENNQE